MIKITKDEAEKLMGPVMRESNAMAEYGYNIPLDDPTTEFFTLEDEDGIVVIKSGGKEYTFDGLGWGVATA